MVSLFRQALDRILKTREPFDPMKMAFEKEYREMGTASWEAAMVG